MQRSGREVVSVVHMTKKNENKIDSLHMWRGGTPNKERGEVVEKLYLLYI